MPINEGVTKKFIIGDAVHLITRKRLVVLVVVGQVWKETFNFNSGYADFRQIHHRLFGNYLFPLARLCDLQSTSQLSELVFPPLLQADM